MAKLRDNQGVYAKRILSGNFKSLDDYQNIVGIYKGLQEAEYLVKDVYKNMVEVQSVDEEINKEEKQNDTGFEFY